MPRIDDYRQALGLARSGLSNANPALVADFSGAIAEKDTEGNHSLRMDFLNKEIQVSWPDLICSVRTSGDELPIQEEILLLHYLQGALDSSGPESTNEWIGFQEIPDGKFYLDAFNRRAKIPLVKTFGEKPELLYELSSRAFGADRLKEGDMSVMVRPLPLVRLALVIWKADEEFPPDGNILFDRNIVRLLPAEDVAWLAGMVVYPLMGMASSRR